MRTELFGSCSGDAISDLLVS